MEERRHSYQFIQAGRSSRGMEINLVPDERRIRNRAEPQPAGEEAGLGDDERMPGHRVDDHIVPREPDHGARGEVGEIGRVPCGGRDLEALAIRSEG